MQLGVALPQYDYRQEGPGALSWATTVEWARAAEAAGFDAVFLADHLFMTIDKYGGPPGAYFGWEPVTALGALAGETARVRIGTLVACSPLRPATWLARNLAVVDVLSGGRLIAGVGAGWNQAEFVAAGVPFLPHRRRIEQLARDLDTMKATWLGEGPPARPLPAQRPHPPRWVGGKGDRLLDVAARHAEGWNTVWVWSRTAYRERVAALAERCEAAGRDPAAVERSLGLYTLIGEDEADLRRRWERMAAASPPGVLRGHTLESWREGRLVGTVAQVAEQLAGWRADGVSMFIAGFGAVPFSVGEADQLALLASAANEE